MRNVFLLLVVLTVISVPAFANLVVNPGFETGDVSGWQTWRAGWTVGDSVTANNVQQAFGSWCARLRFASGEGSFGIYQIVPVVPGLRYNFSTWVRNATNDVNWAEVLLYNYAVTDINDIDNGDISKPYCIWKRDSWGGYSGVPGGYLPSVPTEPGPGNYWEYVTGSRKSASGYITIAYKWGRSGTGWTGNMFVDDVSLTPVPEPGSLLALGTGLVGMAGFVIRRRR